LTEGETRRFGPRGLRLCFAGRGASTRAQSGEFISISTGRGSKSNSVVLHERETDDQIFDNF
jgi:hypothetical protein